MGSPVGREIGDVVVKDPSFDRSEKDQWLALGPDGSVFSGPLALGDDPQDLSSIMDCDTTHDSGFIEFTANYTVWPFNENITAEHPDADYAERIPPELIDRLLRWGTFFVDHHGLKGFESNQQLRDFDAEYVHLAKALAVLGFRFKLSRWWSH
ncbi:hypothetical protein [Micrococcoides hystricis]|uniref:Uncharacterized protein n=1 Tax=Micrococcoides hystricis TaxID=1572761 RepID=A0ABV6P949_9MICC